MIYIYIKYENKKFIKGLEELSLVSKYISNFGISNTNFKIDLTIARGLDYYTGGKGFEIACPALGAQKQVCGGGSYDGGIGFALGIDRLLIL